MKLTIEGRSYEVDVQQDAITLGGVPFKTSVLHDNGTMTVRVAGRPFKVKIKDDKTVIVDGRSFTVAVNGRAAVTRQTPKVVKSNGKCAENGAVNALMPGTILSVRVKPGDQVASGEMLLILEAMKMKNEIKAPRDGVVKRIAVGPGQTVSVGDVLVVIE